MAETATGVRVLLLLLLQQEETMKRRGFWRVCWAKCK
uniref:Uncharacterized protein n=1 Tax=Rhizophora mucronata TaxID=61149 RepID=A0A2P2PS96_RHIMU